MQVVGGLLTEGRIETLPLPGNTVLEPWRWDSASNYDLALATLQSIRRRASIRVVPTAKGLSVDVVVQRGVLQLLKEVQEKFENALVMVTHDMGVLANIADRVGIMYAGKIIEEADVVTIFEQPRHPYTRFLINSLPEFGEKEMRDSAPGAPPSLVDLPSGCAFHPRCQLAIEKCWQIVPDCEQVSEQHRVACWLAEEA